MRLITNTIIYEYKSFRVYNFSYYKKITLTKNRILKNYHVKLPIFFIHIVIKIFLFLNYFQTPEFQILKSRLISRIKFIKNKLYFEEYEIDLLTKCINSKIHSLEKEAVLEKDYWGCKKEIMDLEAIIKKLNLQ